MSCEKATRQLKYTSIMSTWYSLVYQTHRLWPELCSQSSGSFTTSLWIIARNNCRHLMLRSVCRRLAASMCIDCLDDTLRHIMSEDYSYSPALHFVYTLLFTEGFNPGKHIFIIGLWLNVLHNFFIVHS